MKVLAPLSGINQQRGHILDFRGGGGRNRSREKQSITLGRLITSALVTETLAVTG